MGFIAAGLAASGLAWLLNGLLAGRLGRWWVAALGPAAEEIIKTGTALLAAVNIFFTHAVFGAVEAARDMQGKQPGSVLAGLGSFAGHCVFGYLAALGYAEFRSLLPAAAVSFVPHLLWNWGVILLRNHLTPYR